MKMLLWRNIMMNTIKQTTALTNLSKYYCEQSPCTDYLDFWHVKNLAGSRLNADMSRSMKPTQWNCEICDIENNETIRQKTGN